MPAAEARCTLRSLSCVQYIRGEVELIFANFGLDLTVALEPVIDEGSLSAVVIMVIVTTLATPPTEMESRPRSSIEFRGVEGSASPERGSSI